MKNFGKIIFFLLFFQKKNFELDLDKNFGHDQAGGGTPLEVAQVDCLVMKDIFSDIYKLC